MKIYKLDINAAQPTNQVLQMQQNAAGMLSVNVTKNGESIRNLSCQIFDGDTEISAYSADDKGFKLDIGDTPKHYTVKATATPTECFAEYILSAAGNRRIFTVYLNLLQLSAGTYKQDEFLNLVDKFGNNNGMRTDIYLSADTGGQASSFANFDMITMQLVPQKNIWFHDSATHEYMPQDTILSVYQDCVFGRTASIKANDKNSVVLSSSTYPAIGYYVDYQMDTLIKPSQNANAFSEQDILPTEADFQNLSTDSFTLSGVTYVPTILSVDGVEYKVLAEAQPASES